MGIRNKVRGSKVVKNVTVVVPPPAVAHGVHKLFEDPFSLPETSTASSDQPSGDGKNVPCFPRLGTLSNTGQVTKPTQSSRESQNRVNRMEEEKKSVSTMSQGFSSEGQPLKSVVESDVTELHRQGGMDLTLLDDIIRRLTRSQLEKPGKMVQLSESEIRQLCAASKQIFIQQPNLLEVEGCFKICGDIHGQYSDLLRLFEYGGFPPSVNYLFLGNFVDHGKQSIETICLLLAYKIKYPENFFLLRGNHECASINRIHGFYDECKRRFNVRIWKVFSDCFNCLPVAALIDDKILCMHGGLSPDLHSLDQIMSIPHPTEVPDSGLLCDLLWSDPGIDVKGWGMNDRGISYTFGRDKVSEFLMKHDLDLVCRGHQVVEDGYEFFADRKLVTIFSALNYRGEYDNAAAMMTVDENLMCTFQILKPQIRAKFMMSTGN